MKEQCNTCALMDFCTIEKLIHQCSKKECKDYKDNKDYLIYKR